MFRACTILLILALASGCDSHKSYLAVPFLNSVPVIDGLPDRELDNIKWSHFPVIERSDSLNPDFDVRYKMCYCLDFLYLEIEAGSDSIIYRDRAYQNGDGIHMVIAKPDSSGESGEFYVLRFSPANPKQNRPARNSVWYYNRALQSRSLSSDCRFECSSRNGKTNFELLVPFKDIHPYNPLFNKSIGLNLCFVKATGETGKNYYLLCNDDKMQSEQSDRKYFPVQFGLPLSTDKSETRLFLPRRNLVIDDSLPLQIFITGKNGKRTDFDLSIQNNTDSVILRTRKTLNSDKKVTRESFSLPPCMSKTGEYNLVWKASTGDSGSISYTAMPELTKAICLSNIERLKISLSPGDYNSLCFAAEDILKKRTEIKGYEDASWFLKDYLKFSDLIASAENDHQFLSMHPGVFRRAFRSVIDSTLQPYSVRLPEGFSRVRKYPLFVMLHGSGSDDTEILERDYTGGKFIEIAPFGRGTSNCYTRDNAEADVKEAIYDAIANFPVDTTRIIIAGFSMGGYGAYRIFYEYPWLFRGVAVFSGHPSLATKWLGPGYPDFLNEKFLAPFRNVPVFIYHSMDDLNCPYDLTLSLVAKLKSVGAKVRFLAVPAGGHGILNDENRPVFKRWLLDITK